VTPRPLPLGLFRTRSRTVYEDLVHEQVRSSVEQRGEGELAALLQGSDTWTIG
jgi:2-oxoglutarate ferredoxin oxidoreductase subunit beta